MPDTALLFSGVVGRGLFATAPGCDSTDIFQPAGHGCNAEAQNTRSTVIFRPYVDMFLEEEQCGVQCRRWRLYRFGASPLADLISHVVDSSPAHRACLSSPWGLHLIMHATAYAQVMSSSPMLGRLSARVDNSIQRLPARMSSYEAQVRRGRPPCDVHRVTPARFKAEPKSWKVRC